MIDNTETSISSPIMMLWFDFRVRTSTVRPPCLAGDRATLTTRALPAQATDVQARPFA
jgi:hypothetical protein